MLYFLLTPCCSADPFLWICEVHSVVMNAPHSQRTILPTRTCKVICHRWTTFDLIHVQPACKQTLEVVPHIYTMTGCLISLLTLIHVRVGESTDVALGARRLVWMRWLYCILIYISGAAGVYCKETNSSGTLCPPTVLEERRVNTFHMRVRQCNKQFFIVDCWSLGHYGSSLIIKHIRNGSWSYSCHLPSSCGPSVGRCRFTVGQCVCSENALVGRPLGAQFSGMLAWYSSRWQKRSSLTAHISSIFN